MHWNHVELPKPACEHLVNRMGTMSSPNSFHTVPNMPMSQASAGLATEGSTEDAPPVERPRYRPAKQIPFELREHCVIYFEEELCTLFES